MPRVANVNTTNIADAVRLGCRTMSSVFNADDNDIPFFASGVLPDAFLGFNRRFSEAHVPGRHLNALLNAEDALGVELEEDAVEKHARAAFDSYSNALSLPLNREAIDGPPINFVAHNVREGLHALYALAKYRDSARAREFANASIEAVFDYWKPGYGWDTDTLRDRYGLNVDEGETLITGLARAIGPLVKYFRVTGHARALELALQLKDEIIDGWFGEDGGYDRELFGTHTHSTTCVMSSLAQLADLTSDIALMSRVKGFYDNGLWQIRDELGWVIESSATSANPDRGEVNNTGDIVETALILGRWGYSDCYEDAELILRCHLLPSQLRDVSFIVNPANPRGEDGLRNVAERHLGAFGFPAPYGHQPLDAGDPKYPPALPIVSFNMDVVGGAVGSLCETYRETTRLDETGHSVNLLFDHDTEFIRVASPYTGPSLEVEVKKPGSLRVRIPRWASKPRVVAPSLTLPPTFSNDYLHFSEPPVSETIRIQFELANREIVLKHRTRNIRVWLRGDGIAAMEDFSADLTFFESPSV